MKGHKHGFGSELCSEGSKYEGTWVLNRREGMGQYATAQVEYVGEFLRHSFHGFGALSQYHEDSDSVVVGQFVGGAISGAAREEIAFLKSSQGIREIFTGCFTSGLRTNFGRQIIFDLVEGRDGGIMTGFMSVELWGNYSDGRAQHIPKGLTFALSPTGASEMNEIEGNLGGKKGNKQQQSVEPGMNFSEGGPMLSMINLTAVRGMQIPTGVVIMKDENNNITRVESGRVLRCRLIRKKASDPSELEFGYFGKNYPMQSLEAVIIGGVLSANVTSDKSHPSSEEGLNELMEILLSTTKIEEAELDLSKFKECLESEVLSNEVEETLRLLEEQVELFNEHLEQQKRLQIENSTSTGARNKTGPKGSSSAINSKKSSDGKLSKEELALKEALMENDRLKKLAKCLQQRKQNKQNLEKALKCLNTMPTDDSWTDIEKKSKIQEWLIQFTNLVPPFRLSTSCGLSHDEWVVHPSTPVGDDWWIVIEDMLRVKMFKDDVKHPSDLPGGSVDIPVQEPIKITEDLFALPTLFLKLNITDATLQKNKK